MQEGRKAGRRKGRKVKGRKAEGRKAEGLSTFPPFFPFRLPAFQPFDPTLT